MKSIDNIILLDLLPPNLKKSAHSMALSAAIDAIFKEMVEYSKKVDIYTNIDHLDHLELNELASQWHVIGYKDDLQLESKKRLVKKGLLHQLKAGTANVISEKIDAIFNGEAKVIEWFENNKDPFTFMVEMELKNGLDQEKIKEAERVIQENKNLRSHLSRFDIGLRNETNIYFGTIAQISETICVTPPAVKNKEVITKISIASYMISGETIVVNPKEEVK